VLIMAKRVRGQGKAEGQKPPFPWGGGDIKRSRTDPPKQKKKKKGKRSVLSTEKIDLELQTGPKNHRTLNPIQMKTSP